MWHSVERQFLKLFVLPAAAVLNWENWIGPTRESTGTYTVALWDI